MIAFIDAHRDGYGVVGCYHAIATTSPGQTIRFTARVARRAPGAFYFLYSSQQEPPSSIGLIEGQAAFTGNAFTAAQVREYTVLPALSEQTVTVTGTVLPRTSVTGAIASSSRTRSFTAAYEHGMAQPVSLAQIAGTYTGLGATAAAFGPLTMTLSPNGNLAGTYPGCTITARSCRG
jgi:hypothetical protein